MANENPNLIIALTGQPPVKIKKDEWPVIAEAICDEYEGQYEFQANRKAYWRLTVRRHNDGRTIVYGVYAYETNYQHESGMNIRGGELLKVADASAVDMEAIITAIERVGVDLENRIPELSSAKWGKGYFPRLVHECIADLPAVEL